MRARIATAAVTTVIAILAAWAVPASATALIAGLGEQNTGFFDDPNFEELRIDRVRVVVPWDTALTNDPRAIDWIDRALARRRVPIVAFGHSRDVSCPGAQCRGPSPAEYETAVIAFRQRWPQIAELTPWNEPNHRSQPTSARPDLAASYYNAARRACPGCVLVAGDLLDDANLGAWLAEYQRRLAEQPAVWGLHNYFDATYFGTSGVDTLAQSTTGEIWLTETGGIVRHSPGGRSGLPYDERRAADSIRWLFALTALRPRVTRMYLYHWQGLESNDFDGGLVGPEGQPRLGLAVVREHVGVRAPGDRVRAPRDPVAPAAPAAAAPRAPAGSDGAVAVTGDRKPGTRASMVLRISGKGVRLIKRGLRVGVACVSARTRCKGRVVVTIPKQRARGRYRPKLRMTFNLRPGRSITRDLRTSHRARRAVLGQYRLQATYCLGRARPCPTVQRRLLLPKRR